MTASQTVEVILKERTGTHGSFDDNARIAVAIRDLCRDTPNWKNLPPTQQLALDEIALKIARVLSTGSANLNPEHWQDISGYGELGKKACQQHDSSKVG